jgi:hypothetical protein
LEIGKPGQNVTNKPGMVANACGPSYLGDEERKVIV